MDSQDEQQELERKKKELQDREQAIRLRELELEVHREEQANFYQTSPHEPKPSLVQTWGRKIVKAGKFIGIVIVSSAVIMMALRLSIWLTHVAIIAIVAFFAYQLIRKDES